MTVPPSWGPRRRGPVGEAAGRAGLPSPALVTAPAALAACATTLGLTLPEGSCVLVCQADRHPATLTVLQMVGDGYRELATQQLDGTHDLDHLITRRVVHTATADNDPLRAAINKPSDVNAEGHLALLESVRTARNLLAAQDRAPILLPAPDSPRSSPARTSRSPRSPSSIRCPAQSPDFSTRLTSTRSTSPLSF